MADIKYDSWSIKKTEDEILQVRLINLSSERELCFALAEKAKMENDRYALAFSYTFLSDYYLATRENECCILYLNRAKTLCEKMHYNDLLMRIYNFYGMFCNSICDEINALDYFLKTLDIAEEQDDILQIASAYNNIATCFDVKHNYREAIVYYKKCSDLLSDHDEQMKYSKAVALTNLCSCAFKLHNLEEIENILEHFHVLCDSKGNEIHILNTLHLYCDLMKQHLIKNHQEFYRLMDEIFKEQEKVENRLLVYQVFSTICEFLLDINDCTYTKKVLYLLTPIHSEQNIKSKKELQQLIVRYCETFESEDKQLKAYKEFYEIMISIENMEQESYSAGLMAKLELHNAKLRQKNLKKENEHLEKLMNLDDLCNTLNRRCFNHDIEDVSLLTCHCVAIAMLDIDYFKEYNDIYGHQKGDQALMEIGKTLNMVAGKDIRVYRYGGDEFSIIFKNHEENDIKKAISFIKEDIYKKAIPHQGSNIGDVLSISCDYAFSNTENRNLTELLKEADFKLYEEKKNRKNRRNR